MKTAMILKPRLSEKAYGVSQTSPVYVFQVPNNATKQSVAMAVTDQFDVKVASVNTMNVNGKAKRTYLGRRGKFVKGVRSDFKKAYVTLLEGQSIPIFAADEEAEAQAEKTNEKLTKAMEKASAKADKQAAKEKK